MKSALFGSKAFVKYREDLSSKDQSTKSFVFLGDISPRRPRETPNVSKFDIDRRV